MCTRTFAKALKSDTWKAKHCIPESDLTNYIKDECGYAWLLDRVVNFAEPIDVGLKFQTFRFLPQKWALMDVKFDATIVEEKHTFRNRTAGFVHADACLFAYLSLDSDGLNMYKHQ